MTRVVGVHGVGNLRPDQLPEQAAASLAGVWRRHLGPIPVDDLAVAYYADLLRTPGRQGSALTLDDLDDLEREMVAAWLAELEVPEGTAAGRATRPLRQAVSGIARTRFGGRAGTEWFVATFFREVARYLAESDGPARTAARARVADAVRAQGTDIVVAHSLGSVVAYETLWFHPDLEIDLLVTLGSPLALPHAVLPRVQSGPGWRRARPPGVRRWVNIADPGDVVAVPPGGVSRHYRGVDVDRTDSIHAFDFHRVANYLASPGLAEALADRPGLKSS